MRSGHTLPFLEPQGLKRIGLKSVQDKCSNLAKDLREFLSQRLF